MNGPFRGGDHGAPSTHMGTEVTTAKDGTGIAGASSFTEYGDCSLRYRNRLTLVRKTRNMVRRSYF